MFVLGTFVVNVGPVHTDVKVHRKVGDNGEVFEGLTSDDIFEVVDAAVRKRFLQNAGSVV